MTASSPTAPSTVARLAAQAARMEAATATAISQVTSVLPSLDPQQAAAALVVAVPIPFAGRRASWRNSPGTWPLTVTR